MTPLEKHRAFRDLDAAYDRRQMGARQEFAAWRAENPDFTSQELLDNWQRIRRAWHLGPPAPPPRQRKSP